LGGVDERQACPSKPPRKACRMRACDFPDAVLAERVAFLFTRYQALILLLPAQPAKPRRRKAKVTA